jgi:hypothetical protein
MKKCFKSVLMLTVLMVFACGFGGPAPSGGGNSNMYMIDDFEDTNYTSNPE